MPPERPRRDRRGRGPSSCPACAWGGSSSGNFAEIRKVAARARGDQRCKNRRNFITAIATPPDARKRPLPPEGERGRGDCHGTASSVGVVDGRWRQVGFEERAGRQPKRRILNFRHLSSYTYRRRCGSSAAACGLLPLPGSSGGGAPSRRQTSASGSQLGACNEYPSGQVCPSRPSTPSLPAGPCSPCGPAGPAGPGSPCGPGGPATPSAPGAPVLPTPSAPSRPSAPSSPGDPDGPDGPDGPWDPASPLGPRGPGIGTGTSTRSGRSSTAVVGSGATGFPPAASTCARSARTSPASVDTAVPRRSASRATSARASASRWMRSSDKATPPPRTRSAATIHSR